MKAVIFLSLFCQLLLGESGGKCSFHLLSDSKSPALPHGFIIRIRSVSSLQATVQGSRTCAVTLQKTAAGWGLNHEAQVNALSVFVLVCVQNVTRVFAHLISLRINPLTELAQQMSIPTLSISVNPSREPELQTVEKKKLRTHIDISLQEAFP